MSLCECGCGTPAGIYKKTAVKGKPKRFVHGHSRKNQKTPLGERFWTKVNRQGPPPSAVAVAVYPEIAKEPCWVWVAGRDAAGYGTVNVGKRSIVAHRVAWFLTHGTWPVPFCLHKCDTPECVNPLHLFEGTIKDNNQDREIKGRGRQPCGEKSSASKLTEKQVLKIRKLYSQGISRMKIAEQFKVTHKTIWSIVKFKTWRHL